MEKCIIAALAEDGAIGGENKLLYHIKEDLKYFKATTMGCPVIMGRRTFESIGRPLPGRLNIVISKTFVPENGRIETPQIKTEPKYALVVDSLVQAFDIAENAQSERCFIIGGAQIYAAALPFADKLFITRIHAGAKGADKFFPAIEQTEWEEKSISGQHTDPESGINFDFVVYEKRH